MDTGAEMDQNPIEAYNSDQLAAYLRSSGVLDETVETFERKKIDGRTYLRFLDYHTLAKELDLTLGEKQYICHIKRKELKHDTKVIKVLEKIVGKSLDFTKLFRDIGLSEEIIKTLAKEKFNTRYMVVLDISDIDNFPLKDWTLFKLYRTELMRTSSIVDGFIKELGLQCAADCSAKNVELLLKRVFGQGWNIPDELKGVSGDGLQRQETAGFESSLPYSTYLKFSLVCHYLHKYLNGNDTSEAATGNQNDSQAIDIHTVIVADRRLGEETEIARQTTPKVTLASLPENESPKSPAVHPGNQLDTLCCALKGDRQFTHKFDKDVGDCKYMKDCQLDCHEGCNDSSLIQPIHELKLFDTRNWRKKTTNDIILKMMYNALKFACACLNSRQNGIIHFGIVDEKEENAAEQKCKPCTIIGVAIDADFKQGFTTRSRQCIAESFQSRSLERPDWEMNINAERCIRAPKFIPVCSDKTSVLFANQYVIEFHICPSHPLTEGRVFQAKPPKNMRDKDKKKWRSYTAFARVHDHGDPANKAIQCGLDKYLEETIPTLDALRKQLEGVTACIWMHSKPDVANGGDDRNSKYPTLTGEELPTRQTTPGVEIADDDQKSSQHPPLTGEEVQTPHTTSVVAVGGDDRNSTQYPSLSGEEFLVPQPSSDVASSGNDRNSTQSTLPAGELSDIQPTADVEIDGDDRNSTQHPSPSGEEFPVPQPSSDVAISGNDRNSTQSTLPGGELSDIQPTADVEIDGDDRNSTQHPSPSGEQFPVPQPSSDETNCVMIQKLNVPNGGPNANSSLERRFTGRSVKDRISFWNKKAQN